MSCPSTAHISNFEYIGNSLLTINNNFESLKNGVCDNQSQITALKESLQALDISITSLSALSIRSVAKFWVKFSGTLDIENTFSEFNSDRYLYNALNVSSVLRRSKGNYRVIFSYPAPSTQYNFSVSNKETIISSKHYHAQVYNTEKEHIDIKVQSLDGSLIDPEFVSLLVFL